MDRSHTKKHHGAKRHQHPIHATETLGLLLIAFLVVVITVVRYWHAIHWSIR